LGGNTFLLGQDFSFYYIFKKTFLGTRKFWGHKGLGNTAPECPQGYGPPAKQRFRTWMKILLDYIFD